jgi:RNA polymerase sigma-70 factor (ECF subfamily)
MPPERRRAPDPTATTTAAEKAVGIEATLAPEPASNGMTAPATAGPASLTTDLANDLADARRATEGDLASFERLYHRHHTRIHTLARRMLGAAEAEEATQDVFVRAWEKLGTFRGDAAFGTWLYRLAINALLAIRAGNARRQDRFLEGELAIAATPARHMRTDLRLDLERAIEHLPDGARQVFTLYDVEGYRHEEIGGLLGITVGTSKSQLHRARMILRAYLKG